MYRYLHIFIKLKCFKVKKRSRIQQQILKGYKYLSRRISKGGYRKYQKIRPRVGR